VSAALRLAVVSAAPHWPRWAAEMLAAVLALPGSSWVCWHGLAQPDLGLGPLQRWYVRADRRLLGERPGYEGAQAAPAGAPAMQAAAWAQRGDTLQVPDSVLRDWEQAGIDLVIWLAPLAPALARPPQLRHGVWALAIEGRCASHPYAGAAGVRAEPHLVETSVLDYAGSPPRVLYRSVGSAYPNSLSRSRRRALSKGLTFMARCLAPAPSMPALLNAPPAPGPAPSALGLALAVGAEVLRNRWLKWRYRDQWQIAWTFDAAPGWDELERFHALAPPPDRFWADPMPLYWQGKHWILFEELIYAEGKGRLLALEVRADGSHGAPQPLMEQDYHLSYPFVVAQGEELYMIPELQQARRVVLYRCTGFPGQWTEVAVLLEGVNAVDATVFKHSDGRWWMWVSVVAEGAECGEELSLYYADALAGPWRPHAANPVLSDIRCARPGGPLLQTAEGLLRPAQNSGRHYGEFIEWCRVEQLSPTEYRETALGRLAPQPGGGRLRMHTVAAAHGLRVADVMVRRRR